MELTLRISISVRTSRENILEQSEECRGFLGNGVYI